MQSIQERDGLALSLAWNVLHLNALAKLKGDQKGLRNSYIKHIEDWLY
jgi:hypothetical protein